MTPYALHQEPHDTSPGACFAPARRRWLHAAAAMSAAAAAGPALAQPVQAASEPRVKGPRVWRDLDQADVDDGFDIPKSAPNLRQLVGRFASNSALVRARLGAPRRLAYGASAIEALDIYPAARPNAPIQVFLHGGAFRRGLAKDYAFAAETFVHAGAHFVVPDFVSANDVGGDLLPLVEQVRRAVAWVHRNARSFGGDPERVFVSGHSSGGHLAGSVLVTDWAGQFGLPPDTVKGGLCCSATFDVATFRLSRASAGLKITPAAEAALDTMRQLDRIRCPVIAAVGALETAEFQRHAREFSAAATAAGKPVQLLVAEGYNHFEIIETLANPYGLLGRAVLEQMKLAQA